METLNINQFTERQYNSGDYIVLSTSSGMQGKISISSLTEKILEPLNGRCRDLGTFDSEEALLTAINILDISFIGKYIYTGSEAISGILIHTKSAGKLRQIRIEPSQIISRTGIVSQNGTEYIAAWTSFVDFFNDVRQSITDESNSRTSADTMLNNAIKSLSDSVASLNGKVKEHIQVTEAEMEALITNKTYVDDVIYLVTE